MTTWLLIYLVIGCIPAVWYVRLCAQTDTTERDRIETAIGAAVLVIAWPIAAVVRVWRGM